MNLDRSPANLPENHSARTMAEAAIVKMIMMGCGGPNNDEMTDEGLRFIRHLMATSRACQSGFVPNFKDIDCVRAIAKDFIRQSGDALRAIKQMQQVI